MKKILTLFVAVCAMAFATSCQPKENDPVASLANTTWVDAGKLKLEFTQANFTATNLEDNEAEVVTGTYTYKYPIVSLFIDGKLTGAGKIDGNIMVLKNELGVVQATCTKQ